jgi:hypothetical protein
MVVDGPSESHVMNCLDPNKSILNGTVSIEK